jgi:hypothetical protein
MSGWDISEIENAFPLARINIRLWCDCCFILVCQSTNASLQKGAIEYLQVLTYSDALESPPPYPYSRAKTAARDIGNFMSKMAAAEGYGANFEKAYLDWLIDVYKQ